MIHLFSQTDRPWIIGSFLLALIGAIVGPIVCPRFLLTYFAPFLVLLYYRRPLSNCLWSSLGCGLLIDLVSTHDRLGIHALAYCLATALLYRQKQHFFQDSLSTLPLMTLFFSFFSSLFSVVLINSVSQGFPLTGQWLAIDMLLMPVVDAIYAAVGFTLPAYFLRRRPTTRDNTITKFGVQQ